MTVGEPAPAATARGRNPVLVGIVIVATSCSLYPVGDAISKYLMPAITSLEIVWVRYMVHMVGIALFACVWPGVLILRTRRPRLQLARGLAVALGSTMLITSFQFIPLADSIAISFLGPVLAVALSGLVLHERIRWHRWIAVGVGFAAVLIIMRPGLGVVHWGASLALAAACMSAGHQVMTRQLGATDATLTTFAWSTIVGLIVTSAIVPLVWVTPDLRQCLLLLAAGAILAVAHLGAVLAMRFAPVSAVAPYNYMTIPSALVMGYLVFGELPDGWSLFGTIVLIGAGLYAFRREMKREEGGGGG
ncbi:MAG: DMT family transporter [Alphaproteobacteria bacterium]|nr:DMT family transporter [Alphaproteobacteria bacterium]